MYQGGSDSFIGPTDPILAADEDWGIDFEGEVAAVTDDVPMGVDASHAEKHIKLLMLVNDVSLRNLIPGELAKGFGFFQSKPATAFSPVAVTPDELAEAWSDGKVHLPLTVTLNGEKFGAPNAGEDMTFNFRPAHRPCRQDAVPGRRLHRRLRARSPTRTRPPVRPAWPSAACWKPSPTASPSTSFMKFGDRVRIEMFDPDGQSIFGAIDHDRRALQGGLTWPAPKG